MCIMLVRRVIELALGVNGAIQKHFQFSPVAN
jgi:hypothetical protein